MHFPPALRPMMRLPKLFRVAPIAAGLGAATFAFGKQPWRVVGTDLLGTEFSKAVYGLEGEARFKFALALDGSRPGLEALDAGRGDLALLTLPEEELPRLKEFAVIPLGYHRVVVLAPADAPLEDISLERLARVFGRDSSGPAMRWGDLGASGDWSMTPIAVVAPEIGAGIALEFFRHVVLRDRELKPVVQRYRSEVDLARHFTGQARPLALASTMPTNVANLKALRVAASADASAIAPTPENLHDGRYPLRLPLHIVFRRERAAELAPLVRLLLSDEAAAVLERGGVVPVPNTARAQYRAAATGE
jgi:phosphate transport system substrate-binding protein